jgi:hypothetical protein
VTVALLLRECTETAVKNAAATYTLGRMPVHQAGHTVCAVQGRACHWRTVRVRLTALGVGDLHPSDDQLVPLCQAVQVEAMSDAVRQHRRRRCICDSCRSNASRMRTAQRGVSTPWRRCLRRQVRVFSNKEGDLCAKYSLCL